MRLLTTLCILWFPGTVIHAADSLAPYTADNVPTNVIDLWKDVDARKDALETEIIKEWKEDGIITRYVIFKIGTFKGADARIAALYTFPEGMKKGPAFVWSHGGGQRAEQEHGTYFAKQGYATLDINWGGREIVEGIQTNTDWGKVDPSQGPQFYPGALRKGTKLDLRPDEHTIDSVVSPRNGNWFLLTYAARRGITFLEQQPEVDPTRLGFTGYSMGGNITSYVAIDERLKAVVPMVGGSGFITADFPGLPGSGKAVHYRGHEKLFADTMESQSYYPHVKIPVLLLSATNDFHSTFENIYQSMNVLPHDEWRVSQNMHFSHSLGPEQWVLINRWFDQYLKGDATSLPKTPASKLDVRAAEGMATFTVTPDRVEKVQAVDVYFSHDPNPRSRFWKFIEADRDGDSWTVVLPVREKLRLFVFANCTYPLGETKEAFQGSTDDFTITSDEGVYLPDVIEVEQLHTNAVPQAVFEDFTENGFRDWGFGPTGGIYTYKFQDPAAATPAAHQVLKVTAHAARGNLSFRFRLTKNKYLTGVNAPIVDFSSSHQIASPGDVELFLKTSDFIDRDKNVMTDWSNITTFTFGIYEGATKSNLDFTDPANRNILTKMEWITE
jgi:hypothetical protein